MGKLPDEEIAELRKEARRLAAEESQDWDSLSRDDRKPFLQQARTNLGLRKPKKEAKGA